MTQPMALAPASQEFSLPPWDSWDSRVAEAKHAGATESEIIQWLAGKPNLSHYDHREIGRWLSGTSPVRNAAAHGATPQQVFDRLGLETTAPESWNLAAKLNVPTAEASGQLAGPQRAFQLTGNALARGYASTLGIPGDLESLGRSGINALGGQATPETALPTSSDLVSRAQRAGLIDESHLAESHGEKLASGAIEGAASAIAGGELGNAGALAVPALRGLLGSSPLRNAALGAASGGAAGEARELYPSQASWLAPLVGGGVGLAAGLGQAVPRNLHMSWPLARESAIAFAAGHLLDRHLGGSGLGDLAVLWPMVQHTAGDLLSAPGKPALGAIAGAPVGLETDPTPVPSNQGVPLQ